MVIRRHAGHIGRSSDRPLFGRKGEQLKDIDARWRTLRQIRESGAFTKDRGPPMAEIMNATNADIYLVDVSFKAQQG
jgi:hypothetical protein